MKPVSHEKCSNEGCQEPREFAGWNKSNGNAIWRKQCIVHYKKSLAERNGFDGYQDYFNSKHIYRKHRKESCENEDGRLGFICTTTIWWKGMLDVDHIDEDPSNNEPENLQTLCKCCHAYKTNEFVKKYGVTPGRTSMGIKY